MKLTASRDDLLAPLQSVIGVVERRQTMPILANVLLSAQDNRLSVTGTARQCLEARERISDAVTSRHDPKTRNRIVDAHVAAGQARNQAAGGLRTSSLERGTR